MSRWKQAIGDGWRSHMDVRRATEVAVAVRALNRMLELRRPSYVRIAQSQTGLGSVRAHTRFLHHARTGTQAMEPRPSRTHETILYSPAPLNRGQAASSERWAPSDQNAGRPQIEMGGRLTSNFASTNRTWGHRNIPHNRT